MVIRSVRVFGEIREVNLKRSDRLITVFVNPQAVRLMGLIWIDDDVGMIAKGQSVTKSFLIFIQIRELTYYVPPAQTLPQSPLQAHLLPSGHV